MSERFINSALSELQTANGSPIYGYQHLHVTSLEQAMEKIIPLILEVDEYVHLAKQNCKRDSSLLTWDESAAIYLYSMPIGFFTRLNEALRAENRNALKPWFAFLNLFINALKKLPSCDSLVWRGVAADVGSAFVDNDTKIWWSVNSCSKALNVVELYLGNKGTVFAIDAANGKDISAFSTFEQEQEVILMPGSHFRVKSNPLNFKNSLFIVHLEEECASVKIKEASSNNGTNQSMGKRFNQERHSLYETNANRTDHSMSRLFNNDVRSRRHTSRNRTHESRDIEMALHSSTMANANVCSIAEPRVMFNLEDSVDLRCIAQKPFKARSLPKDMEYGRSEIMSANNKFVVLFANEKFHLFDGNLKLVRSTNDTGIYSSNLVDMVWCESMQRFIVLTKEQAYVLDPVTIKLSSIQSVQLQEKDSKFVSCTCSNDRFFVVTSKSFGPYYLQCHQLPDFSFISRLSVSNLIGSDPQPKNSWSANWATKKPEDDRREIRSVRYNHQRLGLMMEIASDYYLYVLDLTEHPIKFAKMELPRSNGRLVVLEKSGEWLIVYDGYNDQLIQIALDCQLKTKWESKIYSQNSFFSFSTGFVKLSGYVNNMIMFGSAYLILLLHESLALYQV